MEKYYKELNGEKIWFNNILILEDRQIINPTEEQIIASGFIKYIQEEPKLTYELELSNALLSAIQKINNWDNSLAVNSCIIIYQEKELIYWADKTERNSLKLAVLDCIAMGRETYRLDLRNFEISINISCNKLLAMLSALEVYAIDCYNKTTDHIYNIKNLNTIEEIKAYDYKVGYPEKLIFKV